MNICESKSAPGEKTVELSGIIDESAEFELINPLEGIELINLDTYGVIKINSVGIKKWISFFSLAQKSGIKIHYHKTAPAIVEQLINISNFACGGTVISAVLPFVCRACDQPNYFVKTKKEFQAADLTSVDWPCQSCGKIKLVFDDFPNEYVRFWTF